MEVCLRTPAPPAVQRRQRAVLDRVEALAGHGLVDDLVVVRWRDEDCPSTGGPAGDGCPRPVSDLLVLADAMDLTVAPADESDRGDEADGPALPAIAILLREGGTIVGVYPLEHDGHRDGFEECLAALEAGERAANLTAVLAGRG